MTTPVDDFLILRGCQILAGIWREADEPDLGGRRNRGGQLDDRVVKVLRQSAEGRVVENPLDPNDGFVAKVSL
jgi:hypothetical protein